MNMSMKYEGLTACPDQTLPSNATFQGFTDAMRQRAALEYADSAVDPDWKVLSSPDYPGRVDSKEWIEKRKLRHPNSYSPVFKTNNLTSVSLKCSSVSFHLR